MIIQIKFCCRVGHVALTHVQGIFDVVAPKIPLHIQYSTHACLCPASPLQCTRHMEHMYTYM